MKQNKNLRWILIGTAAFFFVIHFMESLLRLIAKNSMIQDGDDSGTFDRLILASNLFESLFEIFGIVFFTVLAVLVILKMLSLRKATFSVFIVYAAAFIAPLPILIPRNDQFGIFYPILRAFVIGWPILLISFLIREIISLKEKRTEGGKRKNPQHFLHALWIYISACVCDREAVEDCAVSVCYSRIMRQRYNPNC